MSLPALTSRSLEPEIMDDPALDGAQHRRALRGLSRIHALSGTGNAVWRPIARFARERGRRRLRILDLGCGGGDLVIDLARRGRRDAVAARVDGCDISDRAIEFARARARAAAIESGVHFFQLDVLADAWPEDYDIIVSSLLLHHLRGDEIIDVLRRAARATRHMMVMSDLRRTGAGLLLAHSATRVLSRSPVVHRDGPQSVRAALTMGELRELVARAGLSDAHIERSWPQRLLLTWSRS